MRVRLKAKAACAPRRLALASAMAALALVMPAAAQGLVPNDFFNAPINSGSAIGVEAGTLIYDAKASTITARGNVVLSQDGYKLTGQSLVYNLKTKKLNFVGEASVTDPSGNVAQMTDLDVTGGMKQAFMEALTITTYDGAKITADSADYDAALQTLMINATYAPCGDCIDDAGRRIGWSMKATKLVQAQDGSLALDNPTLEMLGVPVAWLPYLWLPDTSETALANLRTPSYSYSAKVGNRIELPFYAYRSKWADLILTPTLMSRQGFLLGAEWQQRFDNGSFNVKASGLYQWDRGAFPFVDAQREYRGAIQTAGEFRPMDEWTAGWSYTAFTDAAYLADYMLTDDDSSVNQVYATYLGRNTYFDLRAQEFSLLGDYTSADQDEQGRNLPVARFEHVEALAPGYGQVNISGHLVGVNRNADAVSAVGNGYVFGRSGNNQHATVQAGWQTQWIGAGGFVASPYLGARTDFAYYDGTSGIGPSETTLFSATPIAAMDVRMPLAAHDGSTVHIVEPIGQVVYRGSNTSTVGITNDNAQSFVLDDTNLFSYNRFSGTDRQETGLRANIGGRYQANFAGGGYVEVIAGQSFQLAGQNAFATADGVQTGVGSGMEDTASYGVLGAYAALDEGLKFGGKVQVDTEEPSIARAGVAASFTHEGYATSLDYTYLAAIPETGMTQDRHEVGGSVTIPIAEYWSLGGNVYWDLASNSWLQYGAGVTYDDGFLVLGAEATAFGPTHTTDEGVKVMANFRLRAPAGFDLGHSVSSTISDN